MVFVCVTMDAGDNFLCCEDFTLVFGELLRLAIIHFSLLQCNQNWSLIRLDHCSGESHELDDCCYML